MYILNIGIIIAAQNLQCSNLFLLVDLFFTDDHEWDNRFIERVYNLESELILKSHELENSPYFIDLKMSLIIRCIDICSTDMKENTASTLRNDC